MSAVSGGKQPTRMLLNRESVAAVRLELIWSPAGPESTEVNELLKGKVLAHGSGFLYRIDGHDFLVTARHNLTGRHWQTNACLGHPPVEPTHLRIAFLPQTPPEGWPITVEKAEGAAEPTGSMRIPLSVFSVPLLGEDWKPLWLQHPRHGMDVAAVSITKIVNAILAIPWEPPENDPAVWTEVGVGDDVFVVGYPYGLSTGPLLPLWIRGTIASEPGVGFPVNGEYMPLMLVDARTRKGQSGSAVIRRKPRGTPVFNEEGVSGFLLGPRSELVGVYSGRTSDESDLGYVWPIDEVDLICRSGVPGTLSI